MQAKLGLLTLLLAALVPAATAEGTEGAKTGKTAQPKTPTSAHEIENAKSQGLVWVNLSTRTYYKEGELYGKGKRGKFITEKQAIKEGFREAKGPAASKKAGKKKERTQSGIDETIESHAPDPPKP